MTQHLGDELSGLLDGELSADEAAAAHAHLAGCALCTAELAAFDRTRSLVRALPSVDPPSGRVDLAPRRPWIAAVAGVAAAIGVVLLQYVPAEHPVAPKVATLVEVHATSGVNNDPTQLAPAAVPVDYRP
jgi:anti-sigma factor RsiW